MVEIALTWLIDNEPECEISNILNCQKVKWFKETSLLQRGSIDSMMTHY